MKILLVNPNSHNKYAIHPLGIGKLAGILRETQEVQIFDMDAINAGPAQLEARLASFQPDVVGVTVKTPCLPDALEACQTVRRCSDAKLIVGGPDPTARPLQVLTDLPADVAVLGEADDTIGPLIDNIHDLDALKRIPGLRFNTPSGEFQTEAAPYVEDLDGYPFTAYDLMPIEDYRAYPLNMPSYLMTMVTGRGCPWKCSFCFHALHGHKQRTTSAKYVVDEIVHNIETLPVNVRSVLFCDDTFTIDRERVMEMCRMIGEYGLDLTMKCESRVNLVDEELLTEMYDTGFVHISFGVESGNQAIIDEWGKGITLQQARDAFAMAHRVGLETTAYFIIGAPSETPETIRDSIDFAKELNADFTQWSLASPLPSTGLHDWFVEEFGEVTEWGGINYSPVFQRDRPQMSVYRSRHMTNLELNQWVRLAYRAAYLNPRYVFKRLCRMFTSRQGLKANLYGLRDLLGGQI